MIDLQSLVRDWFNKSPHTRSWLLDNTQFVARGPHAQKGYIFIDHDSIEYMCWSQYGGSGRNMFKAADPKFFENLDRLLIETLL